MAYIPGKHMAECMRNAHDIFTHAKNNNLQGMLLLIDYKKAFIVTTLEIFGFGEEFIQSFLA